MLSQAVAKMHIAGYQTFVLKPKFPFREFQLQSTDDLDGIDILKMLYFIDNQRDEEIEYAGKCRDDDHQSDGGSGGAGHTELFAFDSHQQIHQRAPQNGQEYCYEHIDEYVGEQPPCKAERRQYDDDEENLFVVCHDLLCIESGCGADPGYLVFGLVFLFLFAALERGNEVFPVVEVLFVDDGNSLCVWTVAGGVAELVLIGDIEDFQSPGAEFVELLFHAEVADEL